MTAAAPEPVEPTSSAGSTMFTPPHLTITTDEYGDRVYPAVDGFGVQVQVQYIAVPSGAVMVLDIADDGQHMSPHLAPDRAWQLAEQLMHAVRNWPDGTDKRPAEAHRNADLYHEPGCPGLSNLAGCGTRAHPHDMFVLAEQAGGELPILGQPEAGGQ